MSARRRRMIAMNDVGVGTAASRVSAWWLRPWTWMLAGLVSAGVAYLWARATTANEVPLDLLQVPMVAFGVLAAAVAVWLRYAVANTGGLDDLTGPTRARLLMALAGAHAVAAVALSALLVFKFMRPDLPGDVEGIVLLWLLSVPWCVAAAWVLFQRARDGAPLGD